MKDNDSKSGTSQDIRYGNDFINNMSESNLRNFGHFSASFIRNLHEKEGWDADRITQYTGGQGREYVDQVLRGSGKGSLSG